MSDRKKRNRIPSINGDSTKDVQPKRQRLPSPDDEIEPVQPPPRQPDGSGFFKRITSASKLASAQASTHQGYRYSAGIAEGFKGIKRPWTPGAEDNRVKPGNLTSADYEDGYISEEGDTFLKTIHARKDSQIGNVGNLQEGKKSRSGNRIKIGEEATTTYHGVPITYRVDFTEVEDAPKQTKKTSKKSAEKAEAEAQPPVKRWDPHARILAFQKNATTVELSEFAQRVGTHGEPEEQQHFLEGVKGQAPSAPEISDVFAAGVQLRAVGRASDAFGHVFPAFEGLLLSKPQSPQDVRNLFFHPDYQTGALGHQNSGVGGTSDFNSFKEIVADKRVEHTTIKGTDIDKVSLVRKAKAINALVPHDTPIVTIATRAKDI